MKKRLAVLPLLGVAGLGLVASLGARSAVEVKAASTKVSFAFGATGEIAYNGTSGDFTFINDASCPEQNAGWVKDVNARYWDNTNSYNQLGDFFCGESAGWKGVFRSATWTQDAANRYVYFLWAGNAQYAHVYDGENKIVINPGATDEYSIASDVWAANGNSMVMTVIEIPAVYAGKTLFLEIEDTNTDDSDYRFSNFGSLNTNASALETSQAIWDHIDNLHRGTPEERVRYHFSLEKYNDARYSSVISLAARTNVNESFDDQNTFAANWFIDEAYNQNMDGGKLHMDRAIAPFTHRGDLNSENMPINKTGDGFFKGYYEGGYGAEGEYGFFQGDEARYRLISKPFILSGTGFVSLKMAGHHASLHVVRGPGENAEHDTAYDLAWSDLKTFQDSGDASNIAVSGFNTVTLRRHIFNLSAFLGEIIQLAICDTGTSGWSASNYDELITYYPSNPTFKIDTCVQKGDRYPAFYDVYVPSTSSSAGAGIAYVNGSKPEQTDTSDVKAAYDVWTSYLTAARYADEVVEETHYPVYGTNYCGVTTSDAVVTMLNAYNGLSEAAKRIVCASDDYERVGSNKDNWWTINPTIYGANSQYNLGSTLQYFGHLNSVNVVIYNNGAINYATSTDNTAIIVISAVTLLTALALTFVFFKRKQKAE